MSVVKSKRITRPLKACVLAVQLLAKTIDVCSSKNNFPIRKKWAIPSDLYYEVREYCVNINLANDVKVCDAKTAKERLEHDAEAGKHLKRFMILCNVASLTYPLGETVVNSWIGLANENVELFKKWHKSELERYSGFLNG